jgi:hypothetical protein
MLWYLHLCAVSGLVVTSYADDAYGIMEETGEGGGQFTEVLLRPRVTVSPPDMVQAAVRLHEQAHAKCYIARSVSFPVRHEPVVAAPTFSGVARPVANRSTAQPFPLLQRIRVSRSALGPGAAHTPNQFGVS